MKFKDVIIQFNELMKKGYTAEEIVEMPIKIN